MSHTVTFSCEDFESLLKLAYGDLVPLSFRHLRHVFLLNLQTLI